MVSFMSTKKKSAPKKPATSIKESVSKPKAVKKPILKHAPKKAALKKTAPQHKKAATPSIDDRLAKEALKLVDEVSSLLRTGIKTSHKTTVKAREATHKKAHTLLGKATRHLDDVLKASSSFINKAINKI